jgi:hypothetical protein
LAQARSTAPHIASGFVTPASVEHIACVAGGDIVVTVSGGTMRAV